MQQLCFQHLRIKNYVLTCVPLINVRRWRGSVASAFSPNAATSSYSATTSNDNISGINNVHLGVLIKPHSTLVDIWQQACMAWGSRRFIGCKMWVRGQIGYIWSTYESINLQIEAVRTLLHKMGITKGSRVVVISDNRYEWVVVHFATLQLGAQFVPLPTSVTPSQAQLVVHSTQAKVLFIQTTAAYEAVKNWNGTVGHLQQILCFEDQLGQASYSVAVSVAADVPQKAPVRADIVAEDTAMIAFTAGTSSSPKGVMLSHKNVVSNISSIYCSLGEALTHTDVFMSLCSWCVAGALTTDLYQVICKGASVCIPPQQQQGLQDLASVHPSIIVSTAWPFQRACSNIIDIIQHRKWTKRITMQTIGLIRQRRLMLQRPGKFLRLISNVLLGRMKRQLGNELRLVILLGQNLQEYHSNLLADMDVFIISTYGCMEAGGLIASDIEVPHRLKALPGVEIRAINQRNEIVSPGDIGQILVQAPNAMQGYFDVRLNPQQAKNALIEYGSRTFVRTGDYGTITGGWITLKGNRQILIHLSNGKTIDPTLVELTLSASVFIKQIFIYGHHRQYVVALIVPNIKAIAMHLQKVQHRDGVPIVSEREKADCIRAELRKYSETLPARAHVRRFAFVEQFTLANGFVTVKMGFARSKIEKHYIHYFEALYDETPKFFGFAVDDYDDLF